jgi:hypothetical protein
MIGFEEIKFSVSSQQSIPVAILRTAAEKELYHNTGEFHFRLPVVAVQTATVPNSFPCLKQLNQFLGAHHLSFKPVFGPGHLDHAQVMASDVPGFDEPDNISTCKPTVSQQIIKAYPFPDGTLDHIYGFLYFVLGVLTNSIFYSFCFLVLPGVLLFTLLPGHPERLVRPASFFTVKRKVQYRLGLTVSAAKKKGLEAKDRTMSNVRKYTPDMLNLLAGFGKVRVVNN